MSYRMTEEERQKFLAGVHVAVLALTELGRGPLAVPIWYGYEPGGDIWFTTERDSHKGRLLTEGARVSLCVQTETAPYQYVSVEGPVVVDDGPRDVSVAIRYLGPERGMAYGGSGSGGVRIRLTPEHWRTADYGRS